MLVGGGGPDDGHWIGPLVKPLQAVLLSPFVSQDMGMFLSNFTNEDLQRLAELMRSGAVTPVIDRRYPLEQTAEAIRYLEAGPRARQGRRHGGVRACSIARTRRGGRPARRRPASRVSIPSSLSLRVRVLRPQPSSFAASCRRPGWP